uniref:SEFIR domain-containing protein n=1 Tax=Rhabditophanes sp. KR3021 TaxID=114890 RepID=A0AC35U708_9BILA
MPPLKTTAALKAFVLEIENFSTEDEDRHCYFLNVSDSNWSDDAINSSPRFHFFTDDYFTFANNYNISLITLPSINPGKRVIYVEKKMPENPAHLYAIQQLSPNCTKYSHPLASKWTAGFKKISLMHLARSIQVTFVGAPPQYCFEEYEVRLLDESGLEELERIKIPIESMIVERVDNETIYTGIVNFTNLQYDISYIPSVLPIERANDGRCLCPVHSTNPYDNHIVCSCIAAEGQTVILNKPVAPTILCDNCFNQTLPDHEAKEEKRLSWFEEISKSWNASLLLVLIMLLLLCCLIIFAVAALYKKCRKSGKLARIQLLKEKKNEVTSMLLQKSIVPCGPIVMDTNKTILIIYSHDCELHEAAVLAFAEYLRAYGFEVKIDIWDREEIAINTNHYITSSIINSDYVVLVNSVGVYHRFDAVIANKFVIERKNKTPLDSLFMAQLDNVLLHRKIFSIRFPYTSLDEVILPMQSLHQYSIPEHCSALIGAMTNITSRHDARLQSNQVEIDSIRGKIELMKELNNTNNQWFLDLHHQRPITITMPTTSSSLLSITQIDSVLDDQTSTTIPLTTDLNIINEVVGDEEIEDINPVETKSLIDITQIKDEPSPTKVYIKDLEPQSQPFESAYVSLSTYSENSECSNEGSECDSLSNDIHHNNHNHIDPAANIDPSTPLYPKQNLKHISGDSGLISDLNSTSSIVIQ